MQSEAKNVKHSEESWQTLVQHQTAIPGILYVVATPLGNLGDLTLRAIQILRTCDYIACETPRTTQKILTTLNIHHKQLFIYRDSGEEKSAQHLLKSLQQKKSIALVSDAGTPTISDPGYRLVKLCREHGVLTIPIPGSSAALAALSVSGFPSNRFLFLGFLPPKSGTQIKLLMNYQSFPGTLILYESPQRIRTLMEHLLSVFEPERRIFVAREITKLNESFYQFHLKDFRCITLPTKGEYVVLIAPQ